MTTETTHPSTMIYTPRDPAALAGPLATTLRALLKAKKVPHEIAADVHTACLGLDAGVVGLHPYDWAKLTGDLMMLLRHLRNDRSWFPKRERKWRTNEEEVPATWTLRETTPTMHIMERFSCTVKAPGSPQREIQAPTELELYVEALRAHLPRPQIVDVR